MLTILGRIQKNSKNSWKGLTKGFFSAIILVKQTTYLNERKENIKMQKYNVTVEEGSGSGDWIAGVLFIIVLALIFG